MEQFLCYSPKNHRTARHGARCERDRRASASHQIHINAAASRLPAGSASFLWRTLQHCILATIRTHGAGRTQAPQISVLPPVDNCILPNFIDGGICVPRRSTSSKLSQLWLTSSIFTTASHPHGWSRCMVYSSVQYTLCLPHTIIRTAMYAQGNNTRSIYEPIIN